MKSNIIHNKVYNISSNPVITIIMPCFNNSKLIEGAIQSVATQTLNQICEIIIHDDASFDDSQLVIKNIIDNYGIQITAILQNENQITNGINWFYEIREYIRGEYIAFCECDDYWIDDEKIRKQLEVLRNRDVTTVYHNCYFLYENNELSLECKYNKPYRFQNEGLYSVDDFIDSSFYPGQTASLMIKKNLFNNMLDDYDLMSNKFNGDVNFLLTSITAGKIYILAEPMSVHRVVVSKGSSWSALMNDKNRSLINLVNQVKIKKFLEKRLCKPINNNRRIVKSFLGAIICFLRHPKKNDIIFLNENIKLRDLSKLLICNPQSFFQRNK